MSDLNSLSLEQLKTLIEINGRINSNYSDINALLVYILESAMRLVHCESSSLLLNKDDGTLRFVVALGPKGAEAQNIPVAKNSIAGWVCENNEAIISNNVPSDPRFSTTVQNKTGYVSRNMIAIPMRVKGKCIGVIELLNKADLLPFNDEDLAVLESLADQAGIAYFNADSYRSAKDKISILSSTLENGSEYHSFVAKSTQILDLVNVINQVAKTNTTILITGESGVGKELFAEQLHTKSERREKPFVRVNCAALSPTLLESELFGHVKGAFTDAVSDRIGRFEASDGGTIFLDEIGELPLDLQAKLLRVLQEHKFERVGSNETISVDVRVVAATNRNLEDMVSKGLFRSDLYYRLNVVPLNIPPLRQRKDDIEPLASFFLDKFSRETKKKFTGFSDVALKSLYEYYWPGNVRELENSIERACVLGRPPMIQADDLRISVLSSDSQKTSSGNSFKNDGTISNLASEIAEDDDKTLKTALNKFKAAYLRKILDETSWNQTEAGKILGIQRTYVSRLLNELNIR
ncbi:MAG: sigma-54-dependent Fis family transcriptional regulator [Treponema sp.]|nr:sigma-54-dependent Fis family transcriptional regulator [Treponema sp.]